MTLTAHGGQKPTHLRILSLQGSNGCFFYTVRRTKLARQREVDGAGPMAHGVSQVSEANTTQFKSAAQRGMAALTYTREVLCWAGRGSTTGSLDAGSS